MRMLFELIREWRRPKRPHRARAPRQSRLGRNFPLAIDPLEERRLLTVSVAMPLTADAAVVGRSIFYNNSKFDGNNPQANAADDGAIAPDKQALLPGAKATFANYTSYSGGINGIMVDIANLAGPLTANDFVFRVGNNSDPRGWAAAPAPASISVRAGAGAGGSARVTITWADDAIVNRWLQVTVRATAATGLARPDVFYFGNAIGDSGDRSNRAIVDVQDELNARNNPRGWANLAAIDNAYDYNRDGLVSPADELLARKFWTSIKTSLQLITADATSSVAEVLARQTFYNNSAFDGGSASASSADDAAIATDKTALLPGGTASFANYTSYSRGLNGIMIDVAGLPGTPTLADFTFRVGNSNNPDSWTAAPPPSSITVRQGAGVLGSARVTLIWPVGAIQDQWLQVSMLPSARTGLSKCDVFYFGNQIGETGDSPTSAAVTVPDLVRARAAATPGPVAVTSPFDINRDRAIDTDDEALIKANYSGSILNLINLAPTVAQSSSDVIFSDFVSAAVAGRYVFYNNSSYDGFTPAAAAGDDAAIATDKTALLPGGKATFANYTSYSRGINGIMVDVAGLSGTPTAADFAFRVGNSSNPDSWVAAPAPTSITVRRGAGVGGSDRVTIVWADNAIQKQWLQVTVRATSNTGLANSDVFYFGNAIGDVGNMAPDTRITPLDVLWARNNAVPATTIADVADFNRDGLVDIADEAIATWNMNTVTSALQLISAPNVSLVTAPEREPLELFHRGDGGINVFFAPNLVTTNRGTVLAFAEGRTGEDDPTSYAIVLRRSLDGGQTWSPISIAYGIQPYTTSFINGPAVVVDAVTGQIFVVFTKDVDTVFFISSSDDGLTWSSPVDITSSVKVTADGNPNPSAFSSDPWGWYAVGPGHGIQLTSGPNAGRLLLTADHRLSDDRSGPSWSHVIYSDDHGLTWHLGGGLDQSNPDNDYSNECTVAELSDGSLYMSVRTNDGAAVRGFSRSTDGGMTWTDMGRAPELTTFDVQATLLRVDANTILLAAPDSQDGTRHQMTLWISHDNAATWTKTQTVFYGYAGYSDMTLVGPGTVLLAYNRGHANGNSWESIGLARFTIDWLESGAVPQFQWNFNEQAPGTAANILGTSIQDYSPWDNRAQAQAATPAEAPRYVDGPNGNRALSLTSGSDSVLLAPASTNALQFGLNESFTIELTMRTSDTNGVIIGSMPGVRGYTLELVDGRVRLTLKGISATPSITSAGVINDGAWHRVAVVFDNTAHRLRMYIDGAQAAVPRVAFTASLISTQPIRLGAYNDGSGQLAFDIDTLRITRAALTPDAMLNGNFVEPAPVAAPLVRSGAPDTLAGLQLWLPSYDATRDYADRAYSDPVPIVPVSSTSVRSAIEASPNHYQLSVASDVRSVLQTQDAVVGSSWVHTALADGAGQQLVVRNSNGTSPTNFDFIQNTGVFTLSLFVKTSTFVNGNVALFDNTEATASNAGFSLLLSSTGSLTMFISAGNGTTRLVENTPAGLVPLGAWCQIVVVGNGPGKPLTYYVTPAGDHTVNPYNFGHAIAGANGNYQSDAAHDLTIGATSNRGYASFNGQMVDQAIYNRALTPQEVQQLFDFTTRR